MKTCKCSFVVRMSVDCVLVCPLALQSVENLPTVFGSNSKAQTAAKTVFDLAHRHGNILREGWKNIMDSMLQLFRAELLPKAMVEVSNAFANIKRSRPSRQWLGNICFMKDCRHSVWGVSVWKEETAFFMFCCHLVFSAQTLCFVPQVEDFVEPSGKISLLREETPSNR